MHLEQHSVWNIFAVVLWQRCPTLLSCAPARHALWQPVLLLQLLLLFFSLLTKQLGLLVLRVLHAREPLVRVCSWLCYAWLSCIAMWRAT